MAKLYLYLLFISFARSEKSHAQSPITDSAFYQLVVNNIIQLYKDSVKENLHLYAGTEFTGGYRSSAGHPFFEKEEPQPGIIFYNDIRYPDILLRYDLVRDEVIFANHNDNLNIKLITEKIRAFSIKGHLFIHIAEKNGVNFPGIGFYELVYDGTAQVLVKRRKNLRESAKAEEPARFNQANTYFIKKDSVYYKINNKRSLLAVFKDYKTEISKFMQKQNLNFKNDPEYTLVNVVDYYIQLKK